MSLGRGLGALIPAAPKKETPVAASTVTNEGIKMVALDKIMANADQPRQYFNEEELNDLAQSIREHGILQPILVIEKSPNAYEIVAGERRFRAAQRAGLVEIPAMVKDFSPQKQLEVSIIENIQRADLNPMEEAMSYHRLIKEFGLTQEEVSARVGKSRSVVANTLRLLTLPQTIQEALRHGEISMSQGRSLLSLKNADEQMAIFSSMTGQKITVKELEKKIATLPGAMGRNPDLLFLEDRLRETLGAKVAVQENRQHKGSITIHFHSREELNELMKKIIK